MVFTKYFPSYNLGKSCEILSRYAKKFRNILTRVFRYNTFNSLLILVKMCSAQCSMHLIILLLLSIKSSKCKPGGFFCIELLKYETKNGKFADRFCFLWKVPRFLSFVGFIWLQLFLKDKHYHVFVGYPQIRTDKNGFEFLKAIYKSKIFLAYSLMKMRQLHILLNSAKTWHVSVCWFVCFPRIYLSWT